MPNIPKENLPNYQEQSDNDAGAAAILIARNWIQREREDIAPQLSAATVSANRIGKSPYFMVIIAVRRESGDFTTLKFKVDPHPQVKSIELLGIE